eukprot:2184395-Prymnesium_polylepis.2
MPGTTIQEACERRCERATEHRIALGLHVHPVGRPQGGLPGGHEPGGVDEAVGARLAREPLVEPLDCRVPPVGVLEDRVVHQAERHTFGAAASGNGVEPPQVAHSLVDNLA